MAAFQVPNSTEDQFSCQESSLTGHGNCGGSSQASKFLITNPSPGAGDAGEGRGQGRGVMTAGRKPQPQFTCTD